jgi:hypothetical protein
MRTPNCVPLVAASNPTAVATDATVSPILEKRCHVGIDSSGSVVVDEAGWDIAF